MKGGEGGLAKAYIYCLNDVISIVLCVQGGGGIKYLEYFCVHTLRELIFAGTNFRGRKKFEKNRISRELIFAVLPFFGQISFIFLGVFQIFR